MASSDLRLIANDMRQDIIRMVGAAGSGHPGGSLSCIDILAALYFGGVMHWRLEMDDAPGRDRFILSKGHAAPALYTTLAHAGFFPQEELVTLRKLGTRLQGHPDSNLCPGVEVGTGSLGQGISIACGLAAGLAAKDDPARVFCVLGDGECEEGQVWEAATFAAAYSLDNLVAIVDLNGLQIDGKCEDVCQKGEIGGKFSAFGWDVTEVDGHDFDALVEVLSQAGKTREGAPHCIIAHTVKGKGVSFMENQVGWHGKAPDADQTHAALAELAAAKEAING